MNRPTFPPEFFIQNRRRLRASLPDEPLIVLTANGLLQRNGDTTFAFRQDANFWYLTGINEPGVVLIMDGESEYLAVPPRDDVRAAFDGELTVETLSRVSGIGDVIEEAAGWQRLQARLKQLKRLATPGSPPVYFEHFGFYTNPARATLHERLRHAYKQAEITDIREALMRLRAIKQPAELQAIQCAIDITAGAISYVTEPRRLAAYEHEYEIEADLTREFRHAGADGHAFTPIVASGQNTCMLHYMLNNQPVDKRGMLLFDIGAEVSLYAADIARTVTVGPATKRQREVYEAVIAAQDYAISLLRPGVQMRDYEQQVETFIGKQLMELGVIDKLERDRIRHYYPHAASHFMGLDVHDVGDYGAPLQAGMVLTCEPGIYIPEEGIGVRVEDDVLLTNDGNQVLSAALPRSLS